MEPGEGLLEALSREVEEETGWRVNDSPQLARPKHVAFRWVGVDDLDLFEENRGLAGNLVRHLAELALRSSRPQALTYPHATAFLDPTVADPLEVDGDGPAADPLRAASVSAASAVEPKSTRLCKHVDRCASMPLSAGRPPRRNGHS